jgi:hypothetical protein
VTNFPDDPELLLHRAVRMSDGAIAVPVAGARRGGRLPVEGERDAKRIIEELARFEGFPRLRFVRADDPEVADQVRWGDDPPEPPVPDASDAEWALFDASYSRFHGNSIAGIRRMLESEYGAAAAERAVGQLFGDQA